MKETVMNAHDFTTAILVDQTPQEAYDAITNVRGWWSEDVDGPTDLLDEEFAFRGEDVHYSRIRVIALVPGERVDWLVLDNRMSFVQDQTEWRGNRIVFEISETDEGTLVRFSQLGLVPDYECFDICSNAWTFFITDSLRSLIATGQGQPMPKWDGPRAAQSA
jgi:hypothetical protein